MSFFSPSGRVNPWASVHTSTYKRGFSFRKKVQSATLIESMRNLFFFFPALVRIYLKSQKFCFCYTTTKTYNLLRLCRSTRAQACEISVFTEAEADIVTVRTVGRNTGRQKQMRIIHSRKWENRAWGSKPGSQTNAGELGNGTKEIRKHVKPARWCTLTWTKLCDEREVRVYKYTF